MVLYSGKKGVDVTPQEHDADDKDDTGEHFRKETCGFEDPAILFVFSHRKHDERPPYGAESGAGNAKEEAAFDGERTSFSVSLKSSA